MSRLNRDKAGGNQTEDQGTRARREKGGMPNHLLYFKEGEGDRSWSGDGCKGCRRRSPIAGLVNLDGELETIHHTARDPTNLKRLVE